MLSNLVRQEKPNVLQFFFDVLQPDAKMYFTSENQILSELKRSTDPKMREVVDKVGEQDSDTMLAEGMEGFSKFVGLSTTSGHRLALFGKTLMIQQQKMVGCVMVATADPKSKYALWVPEDSPQQWVTATPFNKRLDKTTREAVDKAVMHYVEQGMFGYVFWWQVMTIVRGVLFPDTPVDPLCYSSVIIAENPETHHGLSLKNLTILICVCCIIWICAIFALIAENCRKTSKKIHVERFYQKQYNGWNRSIGRPHYR
ncbi:hypothetical protein HDE_02082 [Halotydeus destructor]|nr:hypothetical protein HDE_02082 [Halotydeus destructor]